MNIFKSIFNRKNRIYLDYASATPVRKEVLKAMDKYWSSSFHNPSAIYDEGLSIKSDVENFRAKVAKIVGAGEKQIVFTSSGTEADNLAILGAFEEAKKSLKRPHLIISSIEHPAVERAAEEVVRRGGELSIVPVNEEGLVSAEQVRLAMKPSTFLVSISYANSEIGTVQPIAKLGRIVKEERKVRTDISKKISNFPLLHTDASAAPAYLQINIEKLQCDLLTLDGAKICGPKGIGVLAIRRGVKIMPIIFGGGQERGMRAGTVNAPLIAGFARALELAEAEREKESARIENLRNIFVKKVKEKLPKAIINGSDDSRLPNILSISVPGILSEFVVLKLSTLGVLASVGTACSMDEKTSGSPVIRSIGRGELAESTIRISFGKFSTESEVKKASEIFSETLLRS